MDASFGPYRLKRQDRVLTGPEGPIDLSARSFDILCALLDKPGEVIGKDALFAAAWPGVVVEENTLQVHVSALRKALDAGMIATVHGRGYKYAGPAPETVKEHAPNAGIAPETKPAIVVLPFENLSGDPEQQYFSDGITADITDRLTRFRIFSIIGQHTAAAFRAAAPDLAAIREKLNVDYVVTGSVRRSGDRIRIATRLTEAATGQAVWAERYDRPLADLFDLQDEISGLVAAATARQLEVEINVRSAARPPGNLSSYESLLQGYWHFKSLTRAGSLRARGFFDRAAALDPRNGEALAWLGCTYCETWVHDFSIPDAVKGAELARQSVAIDPANAKCQTILAWACACNNDRNGALRAGERGAMLNPGDPAALVNFALALAYDGRLDEARRLFAQARPLEPLPPLWFGEFMGIAAFAEGRYPDCLSGVEPVPDAAAWDTMYALSCYGHLGMREKALEVLARIRRRDADLDFDVGIAHEPFRDRDVIDRLRNGLNVALSWSRT